MTVRPVLWVGTSLEVVRGLSAAVRQAIGHELLLVQQGEMPTDWKTMSSIGPGVMEIRIRIRGEHRVLYVAKYPDGIYVLHVFEKKTRATSRLDLDVATSRLRRVMQGRRSS